MAASKFRPPQAIEDTFKPNTVAFHGDYVYKIFRYNDFQEALLLNSINHPHIIKPLDIYLTRDILVMVLPKGKTIKKTREELGCLLSALLYLERHDIVYGDLKPINMVLVDGVFKLIDFGLTEFKHLEYSPPTQTYCDRTQGKWRDTDGEYDAGKGLVWALGFNLLLFFVFDISIPADVYYNLARRLEGTQLNNYKDRLGNLYPLAVECFRPYPERVNSIGDLLILVPFDIKIPGFDYPLDKSLPPIKNGFNFEEFSINGMFLFIYSVMAREGFVYEVIYRALMLFESYCHHCLPADLAKLDNIASVCMMMTAEMYSIKFTPSMIANQVAGNSVTSQTILDAYIQFLQDIKVTFPESLYCKGVPIIVGKDEAPGEIETMIKIVSPPDKVMLTRKYLTSVEIVEVPEGGEGDEGFYGIEGHMVIIPREVVDIMDPRSKEYASTLLFLTDPKGENPTE